MIPEARMSHLCCLDMTFDFQGMGGSMEDPVEGARMVRS